MGDQTDPFRSLIRDRARQFAASFHTLLADAAITTVKIPHGAPRANAFAERFVLIVRSEVTDRMLIFGARHLRHVMTTYAAHYNGRRPHRALRLTPPRSTRPVVNSDRRRIARRPVLGGLINEYDRAA